MASPKVPKDKFFEKVVNPYLAGVLQHPQSIEMHEGVLHIRDVEGPRKTGSMEARLEAMEQQVFKCQGMVERGLNANHMMITEFTNKHKIDANDIGKHLSRLYYIDHLQAQIYDLQNQNYETSDGSGYIDDLVDLLFFHYGVPFYNTSSSAPPPPRRAPLLSMLVPLFVADAFPLAVVE
ncbi:40S ribosomal protein S5-1 [Hordeum vulgare]|nr:40S ribosomal protein S5-1 [Hordeum vulgare]